MELDVSQEIGQILDEFATRFGATGAELWAELVRYEVAGAVMDVIWPLAVLIAAYAVFRYRKIAINSDVQEVSAVVGSVGMVVGFAAILFGVFSLVTTLAAPQAATLKGLLP